jgi:aspartyl protease family protein
MTSDQTGNLVYALVVLMMVASGLLARRLPLGQTLKYALGWIAIFAAGFVLFSFRSEMGRVWHRITAEFNPNAPQSDGGTVRIRRGENGHFNVNAQVNGHDVLFMVDSGATTTTLSTGSADAAGVETDRIGFPVIVNTANGSTEARRARIETLKVGAIRRENEPVLVADALGDTNLLGMNFLDSLDGWRVEGDTMILNP